MVMNEIVSGSDAEKNGREYKGYILFKMELL